MYVLAFDTATPAVTVALCRAEDTADAPAEVLAERSAVDPRRHSELLTPGIRDVLAEAGCAPSAITHVAVGIGPGPYTGLRVGIATAQAMAHALGAECVGVPTPHIVARTSGRTEPFLVATDARRKEVFWARYADADTPIGEIAVAPPAEVPTGGLPVVGEGAALYPELLGTAPGGAEPRHPAAAALGALVADAVRRGRPLEAPRPLYLRRPDATPPSAPKRVLQWQQQ